MYVVQWWDSSLHSKCYKTLAEATSVYKNLYGCVWAELIDAMTGEIILWSNKQS